MTIERTIRREHHYGHDVWTHVELDELRRIECLCRLCARLNPGPKNCPEAEALYTICQQGIALSVTRCKYYRPLL